MGGPRHLPLRGRGHDPEHLCAGQEVREGRAAHQVFPAVEQSVAQHGALRDDAHNIQDDDPPEDRLHAGDPADHNRLAGHRPGGGRGTSE